MQQYSSSAAVLNGIAACSQASQQQADDDANIASLNSFLGISSTSMPLSSLQQQQPSVAPAAALACSNDQAIAALLASTVTNPNVPTISLPVQESPMLINSIGTTPAHSIQSIQSMQFSDFGSEMSNHALFGQQQSMIDSVAPTQNGSGGMAAIQSSFLHQPSAVTQRYLSPSSQSFAQQQQQQNPLPYFFDTDGTSSSALGKHNRTDDDIYQCGDSFFGQQPIGVPLSKRVSMPASIFCGTSVNAATGCCPMPLPTGTVMQRVASYNPGAPAAAMITPSIAENTVFDGASSISLHKSGIGSPVHRKVAHNAIERRYRNNINDRICDLRNSVPALQSIRPKSSKQNQGPGGLDTNNNDENENDDEVDDENENEEAVVIDGVVAATKLNKATILGKSTEYIYHLRRSNDLYKRESLYLQQMIRKMSDGDKIVERILQMAGRDSAVATAALFMPEKSSTHAKRRRRN